MRIGISRMSRTPEEAHEVLRAAHACGFEGVQLKPAQYQEFVASPAGFGERYGPLAQLASGGLIVYPGGDINAWQPKVEAVLPFAGAVRAGHVCLCSNIFATNPPEAHVQQMADTLRAIGRLARTQGLAISIHNHVGSLVQSEDDIARLLAKLDPADCGLTLDTAHAAKAGIDDVHRLIPRFRDHLVNVHLKDIAPDGTFCALGRGTLDVPPILSALRDTRYDNWLIVDEETASMDTPTAFRIAAETLRRHGAMA